MNVIDIAFQSMDDLVGLKDVKSKLKKMVLSALIADTFHFRSPIFVFAGNPGTGKIEFAKRMGRIFHDLGFLSKGHTVEVSRINLVSPYIGQTAATAQACCEKAIGGILLVHNFPELCSGKGDPFGCEALMAIMQFWESHRENFCVVFEGSQEQIMDALSWFPNVECRIADMFWFRDLTEEEAAEYFFKLASQRGFACDERLRAVIPQIIAKMNQEGLLRGNVRSVQKLLDDFVHTIAHRMVKLTQEGKQCLVEQIKYTLTEEDIPAEYREGNYE